MICSRFKIDHPNDHIPSHHSTSLCLLIKSGTSIALTHSLARSLSRSTSMNEFTRELEKQNEWRREKKREYEKLNR